MIKMFVAAGLVVLGLAPALPAATLDLSETGITGLQGTKVVTLSNAVLTSLDTGLFIGFGFGEADDSGIVCGTNITKYCEADWMIDFASSVINLTFGSFSVHPVDIVDVMAYLNGAFLGSIKVTTETIVDFSGFGAIDRLVFSDSSTGAGIGFGNFSFDTVAVSPVPLPASLPLLMAGVAGLCAMRRRKVVPA